MIDTIHVFLSTHLDLGYTDPPDRVAWKMKEHLDTALELCSSRGDFAYTVETAWILRQWLDRTDDPRLVDAMVRRIREGRIEVCGAFATQHSALCGPEDLAQICYEARRLRDDLGVEIVTAVQNDVPGYSWAYPQILRRSGIRYFVAGINTLLGGGIGIGERDLPFVWEGIDGSRILTWIQDGYCLDIHRWKYFEMVIQGRSPAEIAPELDRFLGHLETRGYPHRAFGLLAVPADNLGPLDSLPTLQSIRAWNAEGRSPRFEISTPRRFFEAIERESGGESPVFRGEWIPSAAWTLVKPRGPRAARAWRRTQALLPVTETLWALDHLLGGKRFPRMEIDDAYRGLLLFGEHSAPEGPGQAYPALTRRDNEWSNHQHFDHAYRAYHLAEGMREIATLQIPRWMRHDGDAVVVFNPCSWTRTDIVRVRTGASGSSTLRPPQRIAALVDAATGECLPCDNDEMSEDGEDACGVDRMPSVTFVARDVPPLGYRLYSARPREGDDVRAPAGTTTGERTCVLESEAYGVEIDARSGRILSIVDRQLGSAIALPPDDGADGAAFNGLSAPALSEAGEVSVRVVRGSTFQRCEIRRSQSWFPETDIRLARGVKRVEIRNVFDRRLWRERNRNATRWSVYTRFPLNLDPARTRVTLSGPIGVARLPDDLLPGPPADSWPVAGFLLVEDEDLHVLLSAAEDSVFHRWADAPRGIEIRAATIDQGFEVAGRASAPGIALCTEPEDDGRIVRSYAFGSGPAPCSLRDAHRWGWAFRRPLIGAFSDIASPDRRSPAEIAARRTIQVDNRAVAGSSGPPAVLAGPGRALLEIGDEDVVLVTLRRSLFRGQEFFILRLQEIAGRPAREVPVRPARALGIARAAGADLVETPGDDMPLSPDGGFRISIGPFETATVALWPARG